MSDLVRFTHRTRVVDLEGGDFLVRTESKIIVDGQEVGDCAVEDYASTYFMARVLDRAAIESAKNNPGAIASRIVNAQHSRAEEILLRKIRN